MKSTPNIPRLVLCAAALLVVLGCESTEKKRAAVAPPARAIAPSLPATAAPANAPAPKIEEKAVARTDPAEELIKQVDAEYQHGRAEYNAGHMESAKESFDRAFNLMLSSPLDIHADERLEHAFDQLVDGVHSLELAALKEGDGFTEQRATPAPIDEANDITFSVDPRVKAKAEQEIKQTRSDLPLMMTDEVAGYINYFSNRGKGTLERALVRSGRYRDMIQRTLKEEGVPQDLIYLAEAESGFQPLALSRAGARGMWQFVAQRAQAYGLRKDWWVDERQDPERSTRAAAKHLKDLYNQFGDWYLALAAYNSGPGAVQGAVERTGYADFWELYRRRVLPQETKNYVPIILAVTIMAKNPAQYGLQHLVPEQPPEVDRVTINYPVDLRLVAECVDASLPALQELNPALLRMTTPRDASFELRLPAGSKDRYERAIAAIPADMRVWWRYHRVGEGDTLAAVAKKYKASSREIAAVNNLSGDELAPDAKLIIPVTPGRATTTTTYQRATVRYKVRAGDTVLSVADEWGVPPEMVRKWNGLKGNELRRGRFLAIHRPADERSQVSGQKAARGGKSSTKSSLQASNRTVHTVRPGDTLFSIASRYNTTVAQLRRDNHVAATLKPGEKIVIRR
jgi:membrane-bound lytic murein transglycosylase D